MIQQANAEELAVLERSLVADTRKGVVSALAAARKRVEAEERERARVAAMYDYERELASEHGASVWVGLDEVGRGPLAGPFCGVTTEAAESGSERF